MALVVAVVLVGAAFVVRGLVWGGRGNLFGGDAATASDAVVVPLVCADEIGAFCRDVVDHFAATKPTVDDRPIRVELTQMDSAAAAEAIVERRSRPLAWIPASSAWVDEVNTRYRARNGTDVFLKSGEYQVLPVAESPMVLLVQADRKPALEAHCGGTITWQCLHTAVTDPGGWHSIGGDPTWGLVKFKHANPIQVNSGMLSLVLMAYGYYGDIADLTPAQVADPGLRDFVTDIEASVDSFPRSPADFDLNLVSFGASNYDVAATYEFTAVKAIANAPGRGFELALVYPPQINRSDFPFAIAVTDDSSAVDKDAALALRDFFLSEEMQRRALDSGLRPANPDVPIAGGDNPLAAHTADGVQVRIPPSREADFPSFETVQALRQLWLQEVNR